LAEEARIIRKEEKRRPAHPLREEMYLHRIHVVRVAARETYIAYGLIRGRTLEQIERPGSKPFNKANVDKMVAKYGAPVQSPHSSVVERPVLTREAGGSTPSAGAKLAA
jgi:hypothetical protein